MDPGSPSLNLGLSETLISLQQILHRAFVIPFSKYSLTPPTPFRFLLKAFPGIGIFTRLHSL